MVFEQYFKKEKRTNVELVQRKTFFLFLRKSALFSVAAALHLLKLWKTPKQVCVLDVWEARACGYEQKAPAVAVDHMVAYLAKKIHKWLIGPGLLQLSQGLLKWSGSHLEDAVHCRNTQCSSKQVKCRWCLEIVTAIGKLGVTQEEAVPIMIENPMYQWSYWE